MDIIELKNARWNNEIRKCPTSKTLQRLQKHQAKATEKLSIIELKNARWNNEIHTEYF